MIMSEMMVVSVNMGAENVVLIVMGKRMRIRGARRGGWRVISESFMLTRRRK